MTNPDPGRETRVVDVKGRTVVVRQLTQAQMMLLARESQVTQRDDVGGPRKIQAISRMFDILESSLAQEVDRAYLLDLVVQGNLELSDLFGFITAFQTEQTEEAPKVRRGRPPRARS